MGALASYLGANVGGLCFYVLAHTLNLPLMVNVHPNVYPHTSHSYPL